MGSVGHRPHWRGSISRPGKYGVSSHATTAPSGPRPRPARGSLSHHSDTLRHFVRKSGIFRVILPVLSMGVAPYVREGYRPTRIISGLLEEGVGGLCRRRRAVPGAGVL